MNIIQLLNLFFCVGLFRLNFGGGSSSNNTDTQTTNQYDQRSIDNRTSSTSTSTLWSNDQSDNSINTNTNSGNRNSVTNTDNSWKNDSSVNTTNINNSVVDGGSFDVANTAIIQMHGVTKDAFTFGLGAIGGMQNVADTAIANNSAVTAGAIATTAGAFSAGLGNIGSMFSNALAKITQGDTQAQLQNAAVMHSTVGQIQNAYADAKGTTQSQNKIILAVVAVAGLVAFVSMKK